MKKNLYWLVILSLLGFSCKKDHSVVVPPAGKKYTVNFSVSNPSAALSAVSSKAGGNVAGGGRKFHSQARTAADTLKKYVKELNYLVYDSSGALIQQLTQDSTNVNFGNVSYNFDPGTYTIVVLGNAMIIGSNFGSLPRDYFYYIPPAKPDLFYQKISLTVAGSNIDQVINLNRLTSQIKIKSTSAVPTKIDSIKVTIDGDESHFSVSSGLPVRLNPNDFYSFSIHHTFIPSERGSLNFALATFVYNTTTPMTVTITRYPASIYPYPVIINNVTCSSNKITLLTGDVFQINSLTDGFQISFDPVWIVQNFTFHY